MNSSCAKKLYSKTTWATAKGALLKPKRLKLVANQNGCFECPVKNCDNESFITKRGCRKHVYVRHAWFYYFDEKPSIEETLPRHFKINMKVRNRSRSYTSKMPSFTINCEFAKRFISWISSTGGGCKSLAQSNLILRKILKFLKFCCSDAADHWDIPDKVVDYCLGSLEMLSKFLNYLQDDWKIGFSGTIGYLMAITHLLDFRKCENKCTLNMGSLIATEVFLCRAKKSLHKKMRQEWHIILNIDYLEQNNCWASLDEISTVIPFHSAKFKQIVINSKRKFALIPAQDLSFATSFIVTVLFILVKASRPMTYQNLSVAMIENINANGIVDQTAFKTQDKYGFDSLIFSDEVLCLIKSYLYFVRPRLNPICDYLLINRNGKQLAKLSDIFARLVFQATSRYVHPTRYRQIIETESSKKLNLDEQLSLSEDQKHTSNVARLHYKKLRSQDIAKKGVSCMEKLQNNVSGINMIKKINNSVQDTQNIEFEVKQVSKDAIENQKFVSPPIKDLKRKKKTPFSEQEDQFLQSGIQKYGIGKWTSILYDIDYNFDSSRQAATLQTRAKAKKFI